MAHDESLDDLMDAPEPPSWYLEPPTETQETLRDKFAGRALTGCLAYSHVNPCTGNWQENCTFDRLAAACYALADAMMKARGEG